jgi:diphthamide biosynthesis protein 3
MKKSNITRITPLLSEHLRSSAQTLTAMAFAEQDQSNETLEAAHLTSCVFGLLNAISSQSNAISATRIRIIDLSEQIHATHREILESAVRILEQTMHGSVARGIKARAEHLGAVAKGLDLKIQLVFPHQIRTCC